MRRHLVRAVAAAALFNAWIAPAGAAERTLAGDRADRDAWPTELTKRPLTLGQGMIEVWAPVQLNASEDADWEPVTLNPSVMFGVTDNWMIGVRHLVGICIGGEDAGCDRVYNDVGAQTRVSIVRGEGLDLALQGGVHVSPLRDDRLWSADAGLLFRAGGGAVAITAAPSVSFGLNDRDTRAFRNTGLAWNLATYDVITNQTTFGNREHLSIPVTLQLQLGEALALVAGASLDGPLDPPTGSFDDFYRIPVGAAVVFTALRYLDVGASLTFPAFGGNADTRDIRFASAFLAFRI
jgi:hypothetical protein